MPHSITPEIPPGASTAIQEYLDDPRFNRTFTLPPNPLTARTVPFTVTYADFGFRHPSGPSHDRVLLNFGPLMASRLLHIAKHHVAAARGVRVIDLDRPGFGGTDPIPTVQRMAIWRGRLPLSQPA